MAQKLHYPTSFFFIFYNYKNYKSGKKTDKAGKKYVQVIPSCWKAETKHQKNWQ